MSVVLHKNLQHILKNTELNSLKNFSVQAFQQVLANSFIAHMVLHDGMKSKFFSVLIAIPIANYVTQAFVKSFLLFKKVLGKIEI